LLDWVVPTPYAAKIVLTADERAELEGWARRRTSAAGLAMRSRIVLAAADGGSNTELSERLGLSITTVRRWRNRFAEQRLDGLVDEPRPGRPRVVGTTRSKR
jgi:transposase